MYLKIGGVRYKVEDKNELRDKTGILVNGLLKTDQCLIQVATDVAETKRDIILVHEVIHALEEYFDIDGGEHIVTKMAHGVFAFIVDNPEFIQDIIKHDKETSKN